MREKCADYRSKSNHNEERVIKIDMKNILIYSTAREIHDICEEAIKSLEHWGRRLIHEVLEKNYGKEYQINLLQEKSIEFYNTLNNEEKLWVEKTVQLLNNNYNSTDELQTAIYDVVKYLNLDPQELKKTQKRHFEIIYNLLLGQSQGPKLGIFLLAINKEKLLNLLTF